MRRFVALALSGTWLSCQCAQLPKGPYACDPETGDGCDGGLRPDGGPDAGHDGGMPLPDGGQPGDLCIDTWCWDHPKPLGRITLRSVLEISPSDVWAVGTFGNVLHYDGQHWQYIPTGVPVTLAHVWSFDGSSVWIAGNAGTIFEYANGTLIHHDAGVGNDLHGVSGSAARKLVIVGNNGLVLEYDGQVWSQPVITVPTGALHDVQVWSATHALAVGDFALELNGTQWDQVARPPTDVQLFNLWAPAPTEVWSCGQNGGLYRNLSGDFTDAGNWEFFDAGTFNTLNAVWTLGPDHPFWGGQNQGLWESDNGVVTQPSMQSTYAIDGLAEDDIWAAGYQNLIHRSVKGAYFDVHWPPPDNEGTVYSCTGVAGGGAIAVGDGHAVFVRDAGVWSQLPNEGNLSWGAFYDVSALPTGELFAAGGDPMRFAYWDAGAREMVNVGLNPPGDLNGVWAASSDDIWAVGTGSYIAHYADGGWSEGVEPLGNGADFEKVWGTSRDNVFIVGAHSRVLRWDGTMLHDESLPTDESIVSVTGLSPAEIWLGVGGSGTIYRRAAAGIWTAETSPQFGLNRIFAFEGEVYAAGDYAWVTRRNAAGDWSTMPVPVDPGQVYLHGLGGVSGEGMVVCGTAGTILYKH